MSFIKNYNNFEDNVYIPKNNEDYKQKYDNKKKIKVNIFGKTLKFLSMVGSENLNNKGCGFTFKMNKSILKSLGSCNNDKDFQKIYPGINCSFDDIKKPKYTEYVWNQSNFDGLTIFSDNNMKDVVYNSSKYKVCTITESKYVNPKIHSIIDKYEKYFDLIFTHNKEIIDKYSDKTIFSIGSPGILDWHQISIFKKNKLVSFPTSLKLSGLEGYVLRKRIKKNIEKNKFNKNIDTYGSGFGKPFVSKSICLKDYRFSICLENSKYDYYVTEKILDVILSGCVPIYWGMPSIGDIFDIRGILIFNNIDELKSIIDNLSDEKYNDMLPYVEKNFEIAKKFIDWDDNIVKSSYDNLEIVI